MMTALLVLSIVDTAGAIVCVALLLLRRVPAPPTIDAVAIARAILNTPHNAADVHEAIEAQQATQSSGKKPRTHYLLQHTHAGITKIVYDGYDSDEAYDAHLEMERNPSQYPGRHQYLENGRPRVDRLHSEIES
jgi:hypothetical protein